MALSDQVAIIGGGMVGLSLAHQLINRGISKKITIIEKESRLGMHTSGRNSGVLHAGIYYKPDSLKAKICINGAQRLKEWISENKLAINNCGKIIVPTSLHLDKQLDLLLERGLSNGATCEIIDERELSKLSPLARSASGRALWSPNTSVVDPCSILDTLQKQLISYGVSIKLNEKTWKVLPSHNKIIFSDNSTLNYDYIFNCAGLYADKIAKLFNLSNEYILIPFKGNYWRIKEKSNIKISTNLYPVPNLELPFLGVHFTPSVRNQNTIYIGPTATLAFGRENYYKFDNLQPLDSLTNMSILAQQYIFNRGRFREYFHRQSLLTLKPLFLKAAQELIPTLTDQDIEFSSKVGVRPQLFNTNTNSIEDDFICIKTASSFHVLNSISPAFTASFAFADLIINQSALVDN